MMDLGFRAFVALPLEAGRGTLADRWARVHAAHGTLFLEYWNRLVGTANASERLSARVSLGRLALEMERKVAPVRIELSAIAGEYREVTTTRGFERLAADYFQHAVADADATKTSNQDVEFARSWLARFAR